MTGCKIGKVKWKSNVRPLRLVSTRQEISNDETDLLEKVLKFAKRGEVTGIVIGFVCIDGSTGYGITNGCYDDAAKSLGVATHLVHHAHKHLFEGGKGRDHK